MKLRVAERPVEESPEVVLRNILRIEDDNGERTIDQIRAETAEFFARPEVVADMALFNQLSDSFAMACQAHAHGQELASSFELNGIFNNGVSHQHDHQAGKHELHKNKDDDDPKNRRKRSANKAAGIILNFNTKTSSRSNKGFTIFSPKQSKAA